MSTGSRFARRRRRICSGACVSAVPRDLAPLTCAIWRRRSVGEDGSLCVWDVNRAKGESPLLLTFRDVHSGPAIDVSTHDAHPLLVLTVGLDGRAVVTDLRAKAPAMTVDAAHSLQVAFSVLRATPRLTNGARRVLCSIRRVSLWDATMALSWPTICVAPNHCRACSSVTRAPISSRSRCPDPPRKSE